MERSSATYSEGYVRGTSQVNSLVVLTSNNCVLVDVLCSECALPKLSTLDNQELGN